MNNNTTKATKSEVFLTNYCKAICKGASKPLTKFTSQMIAGISSGSQVLLSEVARKTDTKKNITAAIKRFSRNLISANLEPVFANYFSKVLTNLNGENVFYVDDSEVTKPLSKKLEGLDFVRDGSDDGELKPGYPISEIVGINKKGQPVSLQSKIYSCKEKGFESTNIILQDMLENVLKGVDTGVKKATFVFDRGFDDTKLMNFIIDRDQHFIIRAKNNRNANAFGKVQNIESIANSLKGKFNFYYASQKGTQENLKASFKKVRLSKCKKELFLVTVHGFSNKEDKPFMALTNREITDKQTCLDVIKTYLTRWRIEEYFKFKKQNFDFENFRVRTLAAIKNLNLLVTMAIGLLSFLSTSFSSSIVANLAMPIKQKAHFIYYRLHEGIKQIFPKVFRFLLELLYPKKPRKQRDLFHWARYKNHIENLTKTTNI
jgi:hypothetical protein